MAQLRRLDSEDVLVCQGCKEDITPEQDKVIIGAWMYERQRFLVFHSLCWRLYSLSAGIRANGKILERFGVKT